MAQTMMTQTLRVQWCQPCLLLGITLIALHQVPMQPLLGVCSFQNHPHQSRLERPIQPRTSQLLHLSRVPPFNVLTMLPMSRFRPLNMHSNSNCWLSRPEGRRGNSGKPPNKGKGCLGIRQ